MKHPRIDHLFLLLRRLSFFDKKKKKIILTQVMKINIKVMHI